MNITTKAPVSLCCVSLQCFPGGPRLDVPYGIRPAAAGAGSRPAAENGRPRRCRLPRRGPRPGHSGGGDGAHVEVQPDVSTLPGGERQAVAAPPSPSLTDLETSIQTLAAAAVSFNASVPTPSPHNQN